MCMQSLQSNTLGHITLYDRVNGGKADLTSFLFSRWFGNVPRNNGLRVKQVNSFRYLFVFVYLIPFTLQFARSCSNVAQRLYVDAKADCISIVPFPKIPNVEDSFRHMGTKYMFSFCQGCYVSECL